MTHRLLPLLLACCFGVLHTGCAAAPMLPGDAEPPVDTMDPETPPGWADECGNGLDDDSDGRVDEDCMCEAGTQQDCWLGDPAHAGVGACTFGTQDCVTGLEFGTWDACLGQGVPAEELCDGIDNNCDGTVDEGCECLSDEEESCYDGPEGTLGVGLCNGGVRVCLDTSDGGSEWSGCEGSVLPAEEVCDGVYDEDCDGMIDEGCTCTFGEDRDCYGGPVGTLGVGECGAGVQACEGDAGESTWGACVGEVLPATESCTGGLDEDCDGAMDCDDTDCALDAACCTPYGETFPVVPAEGEIMFVVDRSGSMLWPAVGTSRSRWDELETAMGTVMPDLDELHTGLMTFPEMTAGNELLNCMVSPGPDLGLAAGSDAAILDRLEVAAPGFGDTPTPAAFATIQAYFEANPTTRQRYVVLATDGLPEPNCGATVEATVTAINRLRTELGVETFVLGIVGPSKTGDTSGIPALRDALNRFADAGGRPRAGALRYYEAVDGAALTRGLQQIVAAATECSVELSAAPERPGNVEIFQGGTLVPPSGYSLTGGTHLEFTGAYCDSIQAGVVTDVSVVDSCTTL